MSTDEAEIQQDLRRLQELQPQVRQCRQSGRHCYSADRGHRSRDGLLAFAVVPFPLAAWVNILGQGQQNLLNS